ncbi:hypothetical protein Hanom_Chr10g00910331 [Helianthus anomalus]
MESSRIPSTIEPSRTPQPCSVFDSSNRLIHILSKRYRFAFRFPDLLTFVTMLFPLLYRFRSCLLLVSDNPIPFVTMLFLLLLWLRFGATSGLLLVSHKPRVFLPLLLFEFRFGLIIHMLLIICNLSQGFRTRIMHWFDLINDSIVLSSDVLRTRIVWFELINDWIAVFSTRNRVFIWFELINDSIAVSSKGVSRTSSLFGLISAGVVWLVGMRVGF